MTQSRDDKLAESDFRDTFWRSAPPVPAVLPALSTAELPDSEFKVLADNLPTLCWVANGDGYIVWYNRRWHEYCGTSPEEMEGWGWQSVHDPEVLPSVMERWTASIAEGQPFEMTFPLRGADGMYRPFLTRIQPVRDASGQLARWFGVNTEVSGQLAAETALARREARLSAFFDQAAAGMSETDREGRFLQVNKRYCEITGRSRSELLGHRMQELTHPDDLVNNVPLFQAAVGEGGGFDIEKRYLRKDGSEVWVHNSVTAVRDQGGQVERTVCVTIDISARRAAEEQLRRNHSTFYNLIQNNPFGVYVVDSDFRLAEVSLGAQRVFENVRPLIGQNFAEVLRIIWAEPFATEAVDRFRRTLDTGEPYSSPSTMEPRGDIDAIEAYDWRIERLELPDGRFGVVCYFYDLSERHLWETALRDASERIELALDAGAIAGTWVWEVANDRFTADDRFARSFGVDAEACRRGLPLSEVSQSIHPVDWPHVEQLIGQALTLGGPYRAEYRVRQLTGEYHWVEAIGRCDLDDDGKPVRFPGVIVEIEARKRDEEAYRESEARLRALTDNLPAGMVYQINSGQDGSDRRFLYVSQSHEKLTGVPAEAVLRDPGVAYSLILPQYHHQLAAAEAEAIRSMRPFDQEAQFRRADGKVRWCRIISAPRAQADGSLMWDGIQIDITDQKLAEERLRELNFTLEQRVSERAAELAQAQEALRQSQKLESMGQLTGGVAHDFNNLLTPIIGGLDMLQRRRVGDERAQRSIEGALASAERAKTLVQRLLAFARRQPLQPRPVSVAQLILGMSSLLESTLGPRHQLKLDLADDLEPARADANQLEMALLNLALNARDAMGDGGTLTIEAQRGRDAPADGRFVEIVVRDTGDGMDEDTLARAVEPFFSTKGVGQGTGLGLSMVHGLAAQLGGELSIESSPGQGTAIRLTLPLAMTDLEAPAPANSASSHIGAGTVLLVDDEDLVRASTAEMLSESGYTVVEAPSAEVALRRLKDGLQPALLITDHLMPGMTGTELARAARREQPELPVLVISGYAEIEGIVQDLPRLAKPFRHMDLEASIAALIGKERGEDEAGEWPPRP